MRPNSRSTAPNLRAPAPTSKDTMLVGILAALSFSAPNELPSHSDVGFCDRVALNHGCCPACGYEWRDGKCMTEQAPSSAYCKSLLEPTQMGCCAYCHNSWDGSKCVHAAAAFRDLPLATFDGFLPRLDAPAWADKSGPN